MVPYDDYDAGKRDALAAYERRARDSGSSRTGGGLGLRESPRRVDLGPGTGVRRPLAPLPSAAIPYRQRLAHLLDLAYIPHPLTPEERSDRSHRSWDTIGRATDRPTPIKVTNVSEAILLILAGKTVELPRVAR